MSQPIAESSETLQKKEEEVEIRSLHPDTLSKEMERSESELEKEKRANQEQMEQILKLNEELIAAMEEKQQLQERIRERDDQIEEMRMVLEKPDQYVVKVFQWCFYEV